MKTHQRKLEGKVAIVTGASKGIGASIATHLAAEGAAVLVNYASSRAGADRVVAAITADGGRALAVQADVSQPADVTRLFAEAKRAFGALDVLVNNAGVYEVAPVGEITVESFRRQFDLNVLGIVLTTQEALRHFGPRGGSIVNTSSIVSTFAPMGTSVYNATKGAVDVLTRTFAKELGPRGIRVNSVSPGPIETEGTHAAGMLDAFETMGKSAPLGRFGQPRDIAPVVVFLASAESAWITGEAIYASGGLR